MCGQDEILHIVASHGITLCQHHISNWRLPLLTLRNAASAEGPCGAAVDGKPLGALDVEKLTKEIPHVFWNYITWFNIHAPVQQYRLLGHSWCYKEIWQYSKGCLHDLGSTIVTSICISLVQYSKSSLWNMKPSSYICMLDPCDQTPRRFIRPIFMLLPRSLKTEAHEKNWAGAPEGWKVKSAPFIREVAGYFFEIIKVAKKIGNSPKLHIKKGHCGGPGIKKFNWFWDRKNRFLVLRVFNLVLGVSFELPFLAIF